MTEDDVQRMRKVLEAVLAVDDQVDPFPSLNDIAKRMGFDASTLRRYCPDLSKAIAWHSKHHWVEESHLRAMKQALEDALANAEPESLANVARKLRCSTASMRKYFPDLCRAIVTKNRERFDDALIEQQLRSILASNAEAPAVRELARRMGYELHILWDRFTDLCKQISRRRYAERRRRREERIALLCKEIRRIAYQLHGQGIYPSVRQVSQELGGFHALLSKEGHDAWCHALEALGYPTAHLKKNT